MASRASCGPSRVRSSGRVGLLALGLTLGACAWPPLASKPPPPRQSDDALYRSAHLARARYLEREVERLRADLRQAEEAMVAIESGLRRAHGQADAVSELAETRIAVERAERAAPWRATLLEEAHEKLQEAEQQFQAGHTGSAIFFASRARRVAETLVEEGDRVARSPDARFVDRPAVNLRSGPSARKPVIVVLKRDTPVFPQGRSGNWVLVQTPEGPLGWVHHSLLRKR